MLWLADKVLNELKDEELAREAHQVAEEQVANLRTPKLEQDEAIIKMKGVFRRFKKIQTARLFGSFSRGDFDDKSDIGIVVEADDGFSYFDLAELQHELEKSVLRKIDIGFYDGLRPHILEHVQPDLRVIYERSKFSQ